MADSNFIVKNGLVVNSYFTVNSTSLTYSVNTFNVGSDLYHIANGNLGLGNSSPAHKLSVNGNSYFGGTANIVGNVAIGGISYINGNMVVNASAGINANGSYGTQGQALLSNGSSVYWATATAGSNTQIQFNDSQTANASAAFTFNKTTNTVSVSNSISLGTSLVIGGVTIVNTGISQNTFAIGTGTYFVSNGNVGIGNSSPVSQLHVQGDVVVSGDITSSYSDERLKDIIGPIPNALEKVKSLTGFYYTPNKTALNIGVENNQLSRVGVSAQKVREVLPEIIKDAPIGQGYLTVQYEKIIPLLIEAIKELEAKVCCSNCSCGGK